MRFRHAAALLLLALVVVGCRGGKPGTTPATNSEGPAPDQPPATAGSVGGTYKGKVQRGYDITFDVSPDGKQVSKVTAHVLESCSGSSTTSTVTFFMEGPFTVGADGTLAVEEKDSETNYTSTFKAAFKPDGTASGTLMQKGVMVGVSCTTYELQWEAAKQ